MTLDAQTLYFTLIVTATLGGTLLLWIWLQNRRVRALMWWGLAYLLSAAGLTLAFFRGAWPDRVTIDLANAAVFGGYGLMWNGARAFAGKRPLRVFSAMPAILWLAACQVPAFYGSVISRVNLYSAVCVLGLGIVAREFVGLTDPRSVRWPLLGLMLFHASFFLVRLIALLWSEAPLELYTQVWSPLTALEGVLFVFVCGFLLMALAKSRLELRHKLASEQDYLTRAANRRGFFVQAERRLRQARRAARPTVVVVFDLNRFKEINDTFGHQFGDRVLQLFGRVAAAHLRKTDVFGRLGGDEFAALFSDTTPHEAEDIAARMVERFSDSVRQLGASAASPLPVTATIGVATSPDSHSSLDELLDRADRALYQNRSRTSELDDDDAAFKVRR